MSSDALRIDVVRAQSLSRSRQSLDFLMSFICLKCRGSAPEESLWKPITVDRYCTDLCRGGALGQFEVYLPSFRHRKKRGLALEVWKSCEYFLEIIYLLLHSYPYSFSWYFTNSDIYRKQLIVFLAQELLIHLDAEGWKFLFWRRTDLTPFWVEQMRCCFIYIYIYIWPSYSHCCWFIAC